MKKILRQYFREKLHAKQKRLETEELKQSAIVFSPHYDDETLGCGGTIILKKQLGARIKMIFMTDGSTSHAHLMPAKELMAIRAGEALAAARVMGLHEEEVLLLKLPESKLHEHFEEAVDKVAKILLEHQPDQVFIPYSHEPLLWSEDHLATSKIVETALNRIDKNITVFEYPIWFWYHWPWVGIPKNNRALAVTILKNSLTYHFGLQLLRDFNYGVSIDSVLEGKRSALNQHQSQMTKLMPHENWATLGEIADGEFLQCFFQSWEYFCAKTAVLPS